MTTYTRVIQDAQETLKGRAGQYGRAEQLFDKISKIASVVLDKNLTPYDIAIVMMALKMARISAAKNVDDSFVDLIGYTALAAHLRDEHNSTLGALEEDIAAVAKRFAPTKSENRNEKDNHSGGDPVFGSIASFIPAKS